MTAKKKEQEKTNSPLFLEIEEDGTFEFAFFICSLLMLSLSLYIQKTVRKTQQVVN